MVRFKQQAPSGVRSVYYVKPGQTLENTKISDRSLALIITPEVYQRFQDYATENERVALLAEREAKRLAALKRETYEMSKTWEDTAKNVAQCRKAELLSRKTIEAEERMRFAKEMAAKTAVERAELVKQAKQLILQQKSQCRLFNKALMTAERYRELDEQLKFKSKLKEIVKKSEMELEGRVLAEDAQFLEEQKKVAKNKANQVLAHKKVLEKQIRGKQREKEKADAMAFEAEVRELQSLAREMKEMEEKELKEAAERKEKLNKMFQETIEEKREFEMRLKQEQEYQEKKMQVYKEMKEEMERMLKDKLKQQREDRIRRSEIMIQKIGKKLEKGNRVVLERENKKDEKDKEIEEQRKSELLLKLQMEKEKKLKIREEWKRIMKEHEEEKEKQRKKEEEMKFWETLQSFKRQEFNKDWLQKQLEAAAKRKQEYAKCLRIQMAEKKAEVERTKIEEDDSKIVKKIIDTSNEKVLAYGEKILEESRGVRPIYPIVKALEAFKKEVGFIPRANKWEHSEEPAVSRRRRARRKITPVCSEPFQFG